MLARHISRTRTVAQVLSLSSHPHVHVHVSVSPRLALPFYFTHFLPHSFHFLLHLKFVDNLRIPPKEMTSSSSPQLSLFVVWCSVFPLVVVRPEMPCIMAGMYQMDSSSLVVVHGSGMCRVGFTGYDVPRVMFPSGVASPGCSASWPVWTRKTIAVSCTRLVLLVTMHLALCSFPS